MEYTGKLNLTMLTDFYELTMANGYFQNGFTETIAYFDLFFRRIPDGGGFVIMAGVAQMVEYLENLFFLRTTWMHCVATDLARRFSTICGIFSLPAMFGLSQKARLYSPVNRSSLCAAPSSRHNLLKPCCFCASTIKA